MPCAERDIDERANESTDNGSDEPADSKFLCLSIHDVAPATWQDCQRLLRAIGAVADIPLTLLVVPNYHSYQGDEAESAPYERMLDDLLARGHELALHGYTHLDSAPMPLSLRSYFMRRIYTQREGEFAAIDAARARRLLELGLAWFARRNWPVHGFVAPAWLLGEEAWTALREFPFRYTTTMRHFYWLPQRLSLLAPSLVCASRNAVGRKLSPWVATAVASHMQSAPLIRLGLHPRDARYPQLMRQCQQLLERLLVSRHPLTKASFAERWLDTAAASIAVSSNSTPSRLEADIHAIRSRTVA